MKLYEAIASACVARRNCEESSNTHWQDRHTKRLRKYGEALPHGSGFDAGSHIDLEASSDTKIVIRTQFHHMDDHGGYDGWTAHTVTVKPNLAHGFLLTISGRNRNQIKDYISDIFGQVLDEDAPEEKEES